MFEFEMRIRNLCRSVVNRDSVSLSKVDRIEYMRAVIEDVMNENHKAKSHFAFYHDLDIGLIDEWLPSSDGEPFAVEFIELWNRFVPAEALFNKSEFIGLVEGVYADYRQWRSS